MYVICVHIYQWTHMVALNSCSYYQIVLTFVNNIYNQVVTTNPCLLFESIGLFVLD